MSRLLYSAAMSLDGYIAGPRGEMGWMNRHPLSEPADVEALSAQVGALLIGRRTFSGDDPNAGTEREGPFGGLWRGRSIVLTHDPQPAPPGGDPDLIFVDSLEAAVREAKAAAGGKYVNVLGADVARQCLEAGLLDEILVYVVPVLLGDGTRLFASEGGAEIGLEPVAEGRPATAGMWFRVLKDR